jgi:hypothetical protein
MVTDVSQFDALADALAIGRRGRGSGGRGGGGGGGGGGGAGAGGNDGGATNRKRPRLILYDDALVTSNGRFAEPTMDMKGPIEQLVCARARAFVGTDRSTFTSYIHRMRYYMTDTPDKTVY